MPELGQTVPLAISVFDASGALVVPDAIALVVNLPDATTSNPTPQTDSTGEYYVDYLPPIVGHYSFKFSSTNPDASYVDNFTVTDTSAQLVSLTDVKRHLNITTTTNDDELARIRDSAQAVCESYTDRKFSPSTTTRMCSVGDATTDRIQLPMGATSVATVTENGVTLPTTDYVLDPRTALLYRRSGAYYTRYWFPGVMNIAVTYNTGESPVPDDIRQAVLEMTRHLWTTQRGGMSPILGPDSDDFNPATTYSIPRRVQELLDNYIVLGIA